MEKAVQQVNVERNLSFTEARKIVEPQDQQQQEKHMLLSLTPLQPV